ncbi:MAG TPA: hypothetical protein ENK18_16985 [Deltaproteobacteria bacterium]|nr:hypothetical protein [Deltaproteobacteria bacterium]
MAKSALAVVQPGLEGLLQRELGALGLRGQTVEGGVIFDASTEALHKVHLHARIPTRVWVRVGTFRATSLDALARGVRALGWRPYLHRRQDLSVRVTTRSSRLRFRDRIARKVEHAVCDALRSGPSGRRPHQGAGLLVRVIDDQVEISVDASGEPLYQRGWRRDVGRAPLRENLAAAVLSLAGWRPDQPLLDPMCGSGTFCIEAATIAASRPPGQGRGFAFEAWPSHDRAAWARARQRSSPADPGAPIVGSDRDRSVLDAARANARRAGVAARIGFEPRSVSELIAPAGPGLLVANPPWGERIRGAEATWRELGAALRGLSGWRIALLVPRMPLLRHLGIRLERRATFSAGGIRIAVCTGVVPG